MTLVTPNEEWKLKRIERALKRTIEKRKVPSKKDVMRVRMEHLYQTMGKWLESDRCKKEISYVEELQAAGFDAKKIAAAALKLAAATQKEHPVAEMSYEDVGEGKGSKKDSRRGKGSSSKRGSEDSVQLVATIGKRHGLKLKELVNVISKFGKVPAKMIGDVRISKSRSFVDVPQKCVSRVLKNNGSYKIGRHRFTFSVD